MRNLLENSGGSLDSDDKGAQYPTDIEGAPAPVVDIWSGLTPVGIDCGTGAERCGCGKILLARDQRLLRVFGQGPSRFGIFGLGSTSVEDVNVPNWSPGVDMPCGYVGSR